MRLGLHEKKWNINRSKQDILMLKVKIILLELYVYLHLTFGITKK